MIKNFKLKIKNYATLLYKHIAKLLKVGSPAKVGLPLPSQTSAQTAEAGLHAKETSKKPIMDSLSCPYCQSRNFVKRGFRKKKLERVQLYLCLACGKTFTPITNTGRKYPMKIILDSLSLYNLGYSLERTCEIVNRDFLQKQGTNIGIGTSTLANWLTEFEEYTKYKRMREFAVKKYSPKDVVVTATLAHRQLYRFRYHRAKCSLMILEEYQHRKFEPLQEFLELVPSECPHQYFEEGLRASETPLTFSKKQMIVRSKTNHAVRLAHFVLQGSEERNQRHEDVQKFFLYNDSVTVATEVPVYLTREDMDHMRTQLGFEIFTKISNNDPVPTLSEFENKSLPKLITGHIDILQIRNGQIHILDYKPNAAKEQPIDQLTIYAMALSRLTGLRLYEFKCAWFDEKDYFEFFPLHVLHKPKKGSRRKNIETQEGVYKINQNDDRIENINRNF